MRAIEGPEFQCELIRSEFGPHPTVWPRLVEHIGARRQVNQVQILWRRSRKRGVSFQLASYINHRKLEAHATKTSKSLITDVTRSASSRFGLRCANVGSRPSGLAGAGGIHDWFVCVTRRKRRAYHRLRRKRTVNGPALQALLLQNGNALSTQHSALSSLPTRFTTNSVSRQPGLPGFSGVAGIRPVL